MPILWAIEEFDVPGEAAACMIRHKNQAAKINIPPRSKVDIAAIGT